MLNEMHLNSFAQSSRFTKEVSFRTLSELTEEQENRVHQANNVMVTNNGNVISKSSSSDSDTSSATRLLDNDHDFRGVGYLLLAPVNGNGVPTINESGNDDVMWSQMQSSLSNEIRKRYLIKNRFQEYRLVGLCCYSSSIKLVLAMALIILVCAVLFFLMALFVSGHITTAPDDLSDHWQSVWWQAATFYEIFPASFKDSDGDGFGDIQGLREKIFYLQQLGVQVVRLNSIFAALDYPHQYENVLDFETIDPHLGKMSDFVSLSRDLRTANIRLILDINPTVTSDQHPWAAHWLLNKTGDFRYFYVTATHKPDDLAWTSSRASDRRQSDVTESHASFGGQLLLNWSHPIVRKKMLQVFSFWLDYVDGFYLKQLDNLQIDSDAQLYDILAELRDLLNKRVTRDGIGVGTRKILICSSDFVQNRHKLLSNHGTSPLASAEAVNNSSKLVDIYTFFDLIDFKLNIDINKTETIRDQVNAVFLNAPKSFPSILWNIGDVASSRLATRVGSEFVATSTFLLIMLPGSVSVLYGDEIGLEDTIDVQTQKEYRGGQLSPMPWSDNLNANFSSSNSTSPWLPLHPKHSIVNVAKQVERVKKFNQLATFRSNNFYQSDNLGKQGNYLFHYIDDNEIVFERYFDRQKPDELRFRYVLFANFGGRPKVKDFSDKFHFSFIKISSDAKRTKEFLYMKSLRLDPGEAMIVEVE